MYTTKVNPTTKAAAAIRADLANVGRGRSIYDAYARPSYRKVSAFWTIERRAHDTEGYNNDLHIVAAGCQFFSTIYSYTDADGRRHIIKDTPSNVYEVVDN